MDILLSCEIHDVSPCQMIHTQLVLHKIVKLTFFLKIPFQAIIIFYKLWLTEEFHRVLLCQSSQGRSQGSMESRVGQSLKT